MISRALAISALIASLALAACTSASSVEGGSSVAVLSYGQTAKANYERGVAELDRKSLDRARRYFKHVRSEFPYSRYATLADLRLADCDFAEESYAEAAASYRRFVRLHRTHEEADHAAFRRGLSFYKMIPSDWFLVPPSYERDMSATHDALRELRSFESQYPDSQYIPEANKLIRDTLTRLARHEMYVARFYLRRGKHLAAIGRTEVVEREFAESDLVPEAMFVRGETYMHMEDTASARETFLQIIQRYPSSPEAARAGEYLRHLGVDLTKTPASTSAAGAGDEP